MLKFGRWVGALLLGAACSAGPALAESEPLKWEDSVRQAARETFYDPYSLRDVAVSRPFAADAVFDGMNIVPMSGMLVCMKANAKNRLGAYVGMMYTAFLFDGNTINSILVWPAARGQLEHHCQGREYCPFSVVE